MTNQHKPTNPLMARPALVRSRAPFVEVNGEQVPTDIHDYCAWLNGKERRRGVWAAIEEAGRKTVTWREEVATDDWLREKGMAPAIGKRACSFGR